ncbi:MAG: hypothetical protein ACJ8FJ_07435 [Sphingomicrobium sp.]
MKFLVPAMAAVFACSMPAPASAAQSSSPELWRTAMQSARWTGPMLASNAETLPKGHFYTEPYFFDVISGGKHHPGSSGFYQYGLFEGLTVGLQPNFGYGTDGPNRGMSVGDVKLLSQLRLTHFTPEHRIPTIAIALQETIPTGKYDHLGQGKQGHGSGSFATEIGVNVQQYFLLENGRLLRGRINFLQRFPHGADVEDRSVYGTELGFRGHAKPGPRTTLIGAVEYSLSREWVLALDVIGEASGKTKLKGHNEGGIAVNQLFPSSRYVGFAPAVEYNWSDRTGILLGVWVIPKGHNTPASVTPAFAFSRFW